jgi:hypothetical protein
MGSPIQDFHAKLSNILLLDAQLGLIVEGGTGNCGGGICT